MAMNRIMVAVLCVAVVGALLWCFFGWTFRGGGNSEARRWKSFETPFESDLFKDLSKPSAPPTSGKLPKASSDWTHPNIAVYAAAQPHPPPSHPTLRDLGADAQAHAIDFLAQNSPSSPHSWDDLRQALVDDSVSARSDPFHFDRVLVATVTQGTSWYPGDRMAWTRVFVQPINFKFAGYTVAATENETVKIASIEATSSRKLSASLGLTVPGLKGPAANISPSEEHAVTSTADITAQYERLGVDILPDFLRIIRESETGGDAIGNTTVSLSVVTDPLLIQNRYPGDTHPAQVGDDLVLAITAMHLYDADDNASSLTVLPQAQMPHCQLLARVWMLYEQRQIVTGREFYDESRQTVRIVRDAVKPADVAIMSADDVAPVWFIQIVGNDQKNADGRVQVLGTRLAGGQYRALVFTDYDQASKLASWVRQRSGRPLKDRSFNYPEGASLVPWKMTEDECDKGRSTEVYQKPDSQ
jgi:hypothetical protein